MRIFRFSGRSSGIRTEWNSLTRCTTLSLVVATSHAVQHFAESRDAAEGCFHRGSQTLRHVKCALVRSVTPGRGCLRGGGDDHAEMRESPGARVMANMRYDEAPGIISEHGGHTGTRANDDANRLRAVRHGLRVGIA